MFVTKINKGTVSAEELSEVIGQTSIISESTDQIILVGAWRNLGQVLEDLSE